MFAAARVMMGAGVKTGPLQEITINGGANITLASHASFTPLIATDPIEVTFTGTFTSNNVTLPSIAIGYLNGYTDVNVIIDVGCVLHARGGVGGNSSNGTGGVGGVALDVGGLNNSTILKITNNGTIRGGGGGGGGGVRNSITTYGMNTAKFATCIVSLGTIYRGGGGGGGGAGSSAGAGGARTTSTDGCASFVHGVAGSAGAATTGGARGTRGYTYYSPSGGSSCSCNIAYGGHGGAGGASGVAGNAGTSGVAGGAGKWTNNRDHAYWGIDGTTYGTTHGGYGA